MAIRIGAHVVGGRLDNSRRNQIFGWLEFGEDAGIRIELTGNFVGELAGRDLRFRTAVAVPDDRDEELLDSLEVRQIGVIGTVSLRMVRVPQMPIEEFYARCKGGESPACDEKACLYVEWFSQNGRVVAEIVDPEFITEDEDAVDKEPLVPEALPGMDDTSGPQIVGYAINDEGDIEELSLNDDADGEDDPYALFPSDLEAQLRHSGGDEETADEMVAAAGEPRPWDEVIPGIDEETKQMYEQWDEVTHGTKDEPLSTLFDPPISLKQPEEIVDEAEAEAALHPLLARLALCCVAVDMCEHFSALDTYRWLLEKILPEAHIHPQLKSTGFVQHYSTYESCPQCEAEFEAEFEGL